MSEAAIAELGHNNPPEPTLVETLAISNKELLDRMNAAMEAAVGAPADIASQEEQNKAAEIIKILRSCELALDAERKKVKEPYLEAGKQVDGFFNSRIDKLEKSRLPLAAKSEAYSKKMEALERQRLEELAAKKRQEEADALQRAKDAEDSKNEAKRTREDAERQTTDARAAKEAAQSEQEVAAADLAQARADLAVLKADLAKFAADYRVKIRDGETIDKEEIEKKRTEAEESIAKSRAKIALCETSLAAAREAARLAKEEQRRKTDEEEAARKAESVANSEVKAHLTQAVLHSNQAERIERKADAKPADLVRNISEHGAISTLGQNWVWRIDDRTLLDKAALWPFIHEDALTVALGKWMHAQGANPNQRKMAGAYMAQETNGQTR